MPAVLKGFQFLPEGECERCDEVRALGAGPTHTGSILCRNRASIASGGDREHCSCRACL